MEKRHRVGIVASALTLQKAACALIAEARSLKLYGPAPVRISAGRESPMTWRRLIPVTPFIFSRIAYNAQAEKNAPRLNFSFNLFGFFQLNEF